MRQKELEHAAEAQAADRAAAVEIQAAEQRHDVALATSERQEAQRTAETERQRLALLEALEAVAALRAAVMKVSRGSELDLSLVTRFLAASGAVGWQIKEDLTKKVYDELRDFVNESYAYEVSGDENPSTRAQPSRISYYLEDYFDALAWPADRSTA